MKNNIKKIIKSKIEIHEKNIKSKPILNKKEEPQQNVIVNPVIIDISKVSKRDRQFVMSNPNFEHYIDRKDQLVEEYRKAYEKIKVGGYERKIDVDYDVIVCISSYNRFDKVDKLLSMFYEQESKYTYKIILLDDKSSDDRYLNLHKKYSLLEYHRNKKNNGRKHYWYTMTKLWQYAKNYRSDTILMIDDDFLLCKNFFNTLVDFYYYIKNDNNNVIGIAPHLHSYMMNIAQMDWWFNTYSVDGICLFDRNFIKSLDYQLDVVTEEELMAEAHAHGWSQIQKKIKKDNKMVYKTRHSLVFHDGNDESRLGVNNQKKSKAYTYYFNEEGYNFMDLIL